MSEIKPIKSIGIIMDGNRRWAKEHNMPAVAGYKEGVEVIKRFAEEAPRLEREYGLKFVTLYTFSTENWNRDPKEVDYLIELMRRELNDVVERFDKQDARVSIMGDKEAFPKDVQELFEKVEDKTKNNSGLTVVFALSYGGRDEILRAVNKAVQEGTEVTEESFGKLLYTDGIPDPDIIIRTSGESRLSGFLPWQSVYSELFFVNEHWPAFTIDALEEIFKEYQERERRHGK